MDFPLLFVATMASVAVNVKFSYATGGVQGPVFLQEPPANLVFSNATGSQVSCSAHGSPSPQVNWLLHDGSPVTAVPGLRQTLGNGTLYFPPFRAQDYRKDVHSTVYRCKAANAVGVILSRDLTVKAVVKQYYEIQVYRSHVLTGNTAVLTCVIPAFVKEYVSVTSWFRDDSILLPGRSEAGGRYLVTSGTGNLHIRSARPEDGMAHYSCVTMHSLTHERKRSAPAVLTVADATGSMPPRLSPSTSNSVTAERGSDVHLSCSAQGNPPPTFTWLREINGVLEPVVTTIRISPAQDVLYIRRVEPEDSGSWICRVANQFGEQRSETHLTVTAHLDVHVIPQLRVVNSGETAVFNCSVSGSPVGSVQWLRNGEPLALGEVSSLGISNSGVVSGLGIVTGARLRLLSPLVLQINAATRLDRGMYQCIVRNERESAQGSAELRLGDTVPELQYTFIEQSLTPGPQVSLRCSATGTPPPQFKWLLDGEPLSELTAGHRFAIGQYVDQAGDVISHLNISNVRVEDGGLYSCKALNSLGSAIHSARLNIYGPPSIRQIGPIKAVAGTDVTLHCPFSGYPISSVKWERRGQELPLDLRHSVADIQNGGSLSIKRVDQTSDTGIYKCLVISRNGELVQREMQLVVHSPPILEPFSFPSSLQEGGRAQIACSVTSGDMPIQFFWYKDNTPISPALQIEERSAEFFSMLIFKEVSSRHSGAYTCVASNSAASVNYTAQLMVKVAPQWVIEPQDVSMLLGNSVAVHCEARGYPYPHITWLRGQGKSASDYNPMQTSDGRVELLANGSIWIESVHSQDEGYYLCRAANGIGPGLSKVIHIGVNEPARFEVAMKNMSARRGDPVVLICEVFGDDPIQVSWTHNGNRIDLNSFRLSMTETKTENGLKSLISIQRADRQDSGVYKCQADNMFGRNELIIHLAVQERPDPPSHLEVIEVGSRFVRLTWRRAFDGNSPLLGYVVQYQPVTASGAVGGHHDSWEHAINTPISSMLPGTLNFTLPLPLPGANSDENEQQKEMAIVRGLRPATTYSIRMLAENGIDRSAFTEPPVIVKTQEEAPVDSPQNVQIQAGGPGELLLTWQVPPKDSWNGELLGYIISWNEQGVSANQSKSLTVKGWATTKVQLTGLRKFTRYDVTIRAFNSVASGPPSVPVVGITLEGVPEAAPQHVTCSQISSQSMKISWSPPPISQHGGLIKGYKVFYRPIPSNNMGLPAAGEVKRTSSSETYLHTLYKFTNYSIRVLAYTGAGEGALSSPIYCTTEEDVPGPPASIKAAAITGNTILVSWLPPTKPNGNIGSYTVYCREAGKVGKHMSHVVRVENMVDQYGLGYEVRSLTEHQLYEFWVSATTGSGEGEPTTVVTQTTDTRAPARIASFSQILHSPVKSRVLLPCIAVGNPTPRTRWHHRDRLITFSNYYEVTTDGHLSIHSADQSLAGNYTCSAKNLFGDDEITYTLLVLLAPGPPTLEMEYATSHSIRLRWNPPIDGGTAIQGYTLKCKQDTDEWQHIELSQEMVTYTLNDLQCGTIYHMYLTAHNRVGNGNPSGVLTVTTKGGPPVLPKESDLISTNATALQLNLYVWPDGGCPIVRFNVEYRPFEDSKWILVSNNIVGERLTIQDLIPATWYQLKISAFNDAGVVNSIMNFATTTISGNTILPPENFPGESNYPSEGSHFIKLYILVPATVAGILIAIAMLWFIVYRKNRLAEEESEVVEEPSDEKTAERDNRRNCQQIYMSTAVKPREKVIDDSSEMYEISPYATFSVPGNGSRSVTTSTLDYTVQFKTFGHLENEDNNTLGFPTKPAGGKHSWGKHRYYNPINARMMAASSSAAATTAVQARSSRSDRAQRHRRESESDDTSGSPCNDCGASSAPTYRMPVKPSRGDIFRPDSSTESNEISPVSERRHTPRHLALAVARHKERDRERDRHRPSSSSSCDEDEDEDVTRVAGLSTMVSSVRLQPPSGFSDSRELSEAECDRDTHRCIVNNKLPADLAVLLSRYQEQKEQERREFTIHV